MTLLQKLCAESGLNQETIKLHFSRVRKNALANPYLYDGRYTQKNYKTAYNAYIKDLIKVNLGPLLR